MVFLILSILPLPPSQLDALAHIPSSIAYFFALLSLAPLKHRISKQTIDTRPRIFSLHNGANLRSDYGWQSWVGLGAR